MYKKSGVGVGIGSTSILMLFIVLCLTVFGVLALVTAQSDFKLTQKTTQSIKNFYEADSEAEIQLAKIDEAISLARQEVEAIKLWDSLIAKEQKVRYRQVVARKLKEQKNLEVKDDQTLGLEASYSVPIDERQQLVVTVKIEAYKADELSSYTLLEWSVASEDFEYSDIEFQDINLE